MRPLLIALAGVTIAASALASPNPYSIHAETLLGENRDYYFILVTEHINRGTYYAHTEVQRVQKIDKLTGVAIEDHEIRRTEFSVDVHTWEPSVRESSQASFDLAEYIRQNQINAPRALGSNHHIPIDSTGIYVISHKKKVVVVPISEFRERLAYYSEPLIVSKVEATSLRTGSDSART